MFIASGLIGTVIGLNQHVPTNVMRDSLAYYFSFFYIIGLVLLPTAQAAKSTFRIFYYTALLVLIYCFVYSVVTATTGAFYSASLGMFFSTCAYFLAAKLFSSPPGTRRWLTLLMLPLFSCAMFISRGRGAVRRRRSSCSHSKVASTLAAARPHGRTATCRTAPPRT